MLQLLGCSGHRTILCADWAMNKWRYGGCSMQDIMVSTRIVGHMSRRNATLREL